MEVTTSALLITTALAVLMVKLFYALRAYREKWITFSKLPGPGGKPYPPLGHALLFAGNSCDFYEALTKTIKNDIYAKGKEIGCIWLGTEPVVVVAGAKSAEVLLKSSEIEKSFFYDFLYPWLGTGLLTSKGEKWKIRRKLMTPSFHFGILNEFLESMNEQAAILTEKLEVHAELQEKFDISQPITLCALDIICETAMGKSAHAQDLSDSEYVKAVYRATKLLAKRSKSPWLWKDLVFNNTSTGREWKRTVKILKDYTLSVIKERMIKFDENAQPGKKKKLALLDQLIHASRTGKGLSVEDIREEVDTFMFEGHDTTSAGIAWALHFIGRHRDVLQNIQDELYSVFGDDTSRPVTAEDLRKLNYLEMVIKESLRLLPSVLIISRTTTSDCRMDGYDIPTGTSCAISLQAISNHPKYWNNPEKFIPERFSVYQSEGRHPFAYVPFSAGPRNCIGQKFALMEEKVVLARILRKFQVKSCDRTEDIRKTADGILRPEKGINVILTTRRKGYFKKSQ